MTLQELSQYYKLRERLKRDEEILESLRAAACPGAQNLSGMPHAPGVRDKVGDLAAEIADMTERIRYLKEEIGRAEAAVTEFVESIENDQTRMIFRLRFPSVPDLGRGRCRHRRAQHGGRREVGLLPIPVLLKSCNGVTRCDACKRPLCAICLNS